MAMLSSMHRIPASAIRRPEVTRSTSFTVDRSYNGKKIICTAALTATIGNYAALGPDFECLLLAREGLVTLEPGDEYAWLQSTPADPEAELPYARHQTLRVFTLDGRVLSEYRVVPELFA